MTFDLSKGDINTAPARSNRETVLSSLLASSVILPRDLMVVSSIYCVFGFGWNERVLNIVMTMK